jgi:pimeloyl-ACP methyl ester carboxylesterase
MRNGPDDAPVVVLLHGQPGSTADWQLVVPLLTGLTVLAPNRPGYDGTPPGGFSYNARWLVELLDRERIERAVLAGYSWGGGVALAAAAFAPDRVAALALIGSVGTGTAVTTTDRVLAWRPAGTAFGWLMRRYGPRLATRLARANGSRLDGEALALLRTGLGEASHGPAWSSWLTEQRALMEELPAIRSGFGDITAPAVVLSATRDKTVPSAAGRDLASLLPHAVLREIPAGHLLPLEAPEAVAGAIRDAVGLATAPDDGSTRYRCMGG